MIKENCMGGVEEVYGLHNIPNFDEGDIRVCEGPFMAAATVVTIKVEGQGGHGSTPHKVKDAIACANSIYMNLHTIKSRDISASSNIVFTICTFNAG